MLLDLKIERGYTHEDIADALHIEGDQKTKATRITQLISRNASIPWEYADWILNEYFTGEHPFAFAYQRMRQSEIEEPIIAAIKTMVDTAYRLEALKLAQREMLPYHGRAIPIQPQSAAPDAAPPRSARQSVPQSELQEALADMDTLIGLIDPASLAGQRAASLAMRLDRLSALQASPPRPPSPPSENAVAAAGESAADKNE